MGMNREEFTGLVQGIFAAHNRPMPKEPATLVKWFDRLKEIPLEAARDIARLLEDAQKIEGNFAAQFLECWRDWRAKHPDRCAHEVSYLKGCMMCDRGFIYVYHHDRLTIHCAPCGHCSPFVAKSETRGSLEARGLIYVPEIIFNDGRSLGQALSTRKRVTEIVHERMGITVVNGRLRFADVLDQQRRAA